MIYKPSLDSYSIKQLLALASSNNNPESLYEIKKAITKKLSSKSYVELYIRYNASEGIEKQCIGEALINHLMNDDKNIDINMDIAMDIISTTSGYNLWFLKENSNKIVSELATKRLNEVIDSYCPSEKPKLKVIGGKNDKHKGK